MPLASHHLNCTELATKLGRSRAFICAMKESGYKMEFSGTRSTLGHAEQWLKDHPDFRTTGYVLKHRHAEASIPGASSAQPRKKASTAGK